MTDMPELTEKQLARAIPARVRRRLIAGKFETGDDVAALRRFVGLTQARFAAGHRASALPCGSRSARRMLG